VHPSLDYVNGKGSGSRRNVGTELKLVTKQVDLCLNYAASSVLQFVTWKAVSEVTARCSELGLPVVTED
jgi:hypothetical protein